MKPMLRYTVYVERVLGEVHGASPARAYTAAVRQYPGHEVRTTHIAGDRYAVVVEHVAGWTSARDYETACRQALRGFGETVSRVQVVATTDSEQREIRERSRFYDILTRSKTRA